MPLETPSYKTYCWVLGTTSFRTAQLNLRIEALLGHLSDFRGEVESSGNQWIWRKNPGLQEDFYDYLHSHEFLTGNASNKAKDARQKTSGLSTLGLVTEANREITAAGQALLDIARENDLTKPADLQPGQDENIFLVPDDSFFYLKQLMKATLFVKNGVVRPFYVLTHLLNKFNYLTREELSHIMPFVADEKSLNIVEQGISDLRSRATTTDEIISKVLLDMDNVQEALRIFRNELTVTEDLIVGIGMNRKSRDKARYDEVYYDLFQNLQYIFLSDYSDPDDIPELIKAIRGVPTRGQWFKLLFNGKAPTDKKVKQDGMSVFDPDTPFLSVQSEDDLRVEFFKYLHLFKAKNTLSDYRDLNERYFKLTDMFIFEDNKVVFDTVPKAVFSLVDASLVRDMFTSSDDLEKDIPIASILPEISISQDELLATLSEYFAEDIVSLEMAKRFVKDERAKRFDDLIVERFTDDVLSEILEIFDQYSANRDLYAERLKELVTPGATPSTILEYILAIIWYKLSGRVGSVLDYMKLSLEADLLPRSHAVGGAADIVYQYKIPTASYPQHDLLIEATLSDGTAERIMEMEPVTRHLTNHIATSGNTHDYCVFVAPRLQTNLINDFRSRKFSGGYLNDTFVESLKIIVLTVLQVKSLLDNKISYATLYKCFDDVFKSEQRRGMEWGEELSHALKALTN